MTSYESFKSLKVKKKKKKKQKTKKTPRRGGGGGAEGKRESLFHIFFGYKAAGLNWNYPKKIQQTYDSPGRKKEGNNVSPNIFILVNESLQSLVGRV